MKKTTPIILLSALFLLASSAFIHNDDQLDKLLKSLEQLTTAAPQEKVHLQLDKPYYSLGEDIWLKAYVVNAEDNTLSGRSNILYVDLLDDRDSVKKTLLLPLVNGMADASINLPDSLMGAGNYRIYAYTKWMQNFSTDYFFKKTVPIVNALKGAVSGQLQYKAVMTDNGKQLTSDITYKRDNGTGYNGLVVNYTIKTGSKTLATGKGTTDLGGKLSLANSIKKEYKDSVIIINTTLDLPGGHTAIQNFAIRPLAATADVQFFPEGGQMVEGIRTKVAFKAVKPDGLSEKVSGYISDESNEQVAMLNVEHAGMGVFALMPAAGKTYTAVVKHEDGSESRHPLPKAQSSGYVLNVNRIGTDSLSVRVSASKELANGAEATLLAQCNGVVQLVAKPKLDGTSTVSIISTKKFPTGIAQITLFSPDFAPVAERLVFVEHNDRLDAEIKPDKESYPKRGKVKLDLKIENALGEPVVGAFSVAVTDGTKVKQDPDAETTILSNLLLTSDIKGYVETPNYYFNPANQDRLKHLDQLLLTQGWRRFTWADVKDNKLPFIKYQPEKSLSVTGTITTLSGKPIPKGKVKLFAATGGLPLLIDTIADDQGRFIFNDLDLADSTRMFVRAVDAKDRTGVKVTVDKKPRILYAPLYNAADVVKGMNLEDYIKYTQDQFSELSKYGLFMNGTALKEVKIQAKKKPFFEDKIIPHSANLNPGYADLVIKADRFERATRFLDAFYGLPGIEVKGGQIWLTRIKSINNAGPMMVLMDGSEIPTSIAGDYLSSIPAQDILGVEILKGGSASIYGSNGANGVVIITTRKGGEGLKPEQATNVQKYMPQGYASTKQFYSPEYDSPTAKKEMADLRSTIFWAPNIITDAEGKASLSYFNADGTGNYNVTIEGMDTKGKLLRKTITYEVK